MIAFLSLSDYLKPTNAAEPIEPYKLSEIYALDEIYEIKDLYPKADEQRMLLHRSCSAVLLHHLRGNAKDDADICSWQHTACENGALQTITTSVFAGEAGCSVDMEWLPPTVEYIHFYFVDMWRTWARMCLPRDLRYMHLFGCRNGEYEKASRTVDFSRLPRKMEELILLGSPVSGVIVLACLPETMRLIYIDQGGTPLERILVDYDGLPEGLKALYVVGSAKLVDNVHAIGKPAGVRLETNGDKFNRQKESRYEGGFRRKLVEYEVESLNSSLRR